MKHATDMMTKIIKSGTVQETGKTLLNNLLGVFMCDPAAALSLAGNLKTMPLTIRDGIFLECLETYILNAYQFNEKTSRFEAQNLQSLAVALADASPNEEADYEGNPAKLIEYAKRLIKLIDDCGTKQKANYLAAVTRALLSKQIDTKKFFQLSRCIRTLTEEDLIFLSKHIAIGSVSRSEDYIDDYRALGLLYETNEGFSYSMRAFELKKYALCYENHIKIPDSFPQKYEPLIVEPISQENIRALTEEVEQIKSAREIVEF